MRAHDKVIEDGKKALTTGKAVNGVKGVSPLSSLNLVHSVPAEYMHSVLECVTRMLLNFWFDSKNHGKAFYLGRKVSDIDAVLIKQCPPHEASRYPKSITSHVHLKASELRNWFLLQVFSLLYTCTTLRY